jgi:hypothetical protein
MVFNTDASPDGSNRGPQPPSAAQAPLTSIAANSAPETAAHGSVAPVWLQRLSLFVLVLFCVYLGVMVTILPWWTRIWDRNLFIQSHPMLARVLYNGAVRGLISGLGLLDIWIGVSEAIHYRDQRR